MAAIKLPYTVSYLDRGKMRHQFRRKGFRRTLLRGQPGGVEFMAHYHELMALSENAAAHVGASRFKRGSIDDLILRYLRSDAFTSLAKPTRDTRRRILDRFRDFKTPSGRRYGDNAIRNMLQHDVVATLQGKTPVAQRGWLKALRPFMAFAIAEAGCKLDVTIGIKTIRTTSLGYLTWSDEAIAAFRERHPIGSMARLALELMLNVAARRHDACLLGRQHLRDGYLQWRPSKTLRTTAKMLTIRVLPRLQEALDAMPANDTTLTFLQTSFGQPFASAAAFGNKFSDWCIQAGLKPIVCDDGKRRSYRCHGLRKAALKALAHAGCTGPEIMAISGHASLSEVQVYLSAVEQDRLADAAMTKLTQNESRAGV